jgi:hypothetical protein
MKKAEKRKVRSRGISRDMSPQAISRRFDILVELDRVARELRSASRKKEQPPEQKTIGRA